MKKLLSLVVLLAAVNLAAAVGMLPSDPNLPGGGIPNPPPPLPNPPPKDYYWWGELWPTLWCSAAGPNLTVDVAFAHLANTQYSAYLLYEIGGDTYCVDACDFQTDGQGEGSCRLYANPPVAGTCYVLFSIHGDTEEPLATTAGSAYTPASTAGSGSQ
jgi:hypothetical protein